MRGANGVQADYGVTAATVVVRSFLQNAGAAAPPVAPAASARVYFDSTANRYMVSENAGVYKKLLSPSASQNFWDCDGTAAVTNQGSNLPLAETELDSAVQGTRVSLNCDDLGGQVAMRYNMRALSGTARTITIKIADTSLTSNVLATVDVNTAGAASYTGETAYIAKPSWCTGVKQVAVYTSGGNGGLDYIFRRLALITKP